MIEKLILYLVRKYCSYNPQFRIKIGGVLHNSVKEQYYEETGFGCFYCACGEFFKANEVHKYTDSYMIKLGLMKEFDRINK